MLGYESPVLQVISSWLLLSMNVPMVCYLNFLRTVSLLLLINIAKQHNSLPDNFFGKAEIQFSLE